MQRLFDQDKIGVYLDTITHTTEQRRGEDVKIVSLGLKIQPFTPELAASLDAGLQTDAGVRALLFTMTGADPKPGIRRVDLALGCPRQQILIHATPDTVKESIALDQVRITGTYARAPKDADGYAFVFKASFGPVGRAELEFVQDWHLTQRFLTFRQAEPALEFGGETTTDAAPSDADEKARQVASRAPEWDDDAPAGDAADAGAEDAEDAAEGEPLSVIEQEQGARRSTFSHAAGRRGRR